MFSIAIWTTSFLPFQPPSIHNQSTPRFPLTPPPPTHSPPPCLLMVLAWFSLFPSLTLFFLFIKVWHHRVCDLNVGEFCQAISFVLEAGLRLRKCMGWRGAWVVVSDKRPGLRLKTLRWNRSIDICKMKTETKNWLKKKYDGIYFYY